MVTTTTTLTSTLSGLRAFGTTVATKFVLVWNMFWTFIFLRQYGLQCSPLEYIMYGYISTLTSLIGCVIISTIGLATLVGTIGTTIFSLFLL
jgi:hypothetical protein